jgi:hypothetical protein
MSIEVRRGLVTVRIYYLNENRYERVLRPDLKRGAFQEEEDNLLKKLYEKYGAQWSKIEKEMPWRSSVQLRKRYGLSLVVWIL